MGQETLAPSRISSPFSPSQWTANLPVGEAQRLVDEWIQNYGVRYFAPLTNMAILTEEVGEVARLMSRLYGEQSFKKSDEAITSATNSLMCCGSSSV